MIPKDYYTKKQYSDVDFEFNKTLNLLEKISSQQNKTMYHLWVFMLWLCITTLGILVIAYKLWF